MMIALALLLGGCLVGWFLPHALHHATTRLDPAVAIAAWFLAIAGLLSTLALSIILLALPDHGLGGGLWTLSRDCLTTLSRGSRPDIEQTLAATGVLAMLLIAGRVIRAALRHARRSRNVVREQIEMMRLAGTIDDNSILWLDHDHPMAFSVAGRPGVVVASHGLSTRLSPGELHAVLDHERAHLDGHHHRQIAAIDALAVALPFVPLVNQAPAALRQLVELAADRAAARLHGTAVVRSALRNMTNSTAPGHALAMARESVDLRLACLDRPLITHTRTRRYTTALITGVAAALSPLLTGTMATIVLIVMACPLG